MAGILDLFFGAGPVLEQRTRVGQAGLAVVGHFRVPKRCGYDFDLRLLHKRGEMNELDSLLGGETFPVPVTLRVSREGKEGAAGEVVRLERSPALHMKAPSMTIFTAGHVMLDKGRYRVELTSGAAPKLADIDIDFVVQITPKTSCP